ncbi:MAG: DNA-binding GntR family transcriptional regulator [Candidatus Promineifilaceae bacterium]|jgi:DNA-binding GntR family transcriptional regulator
MTVQLKIGSNTATLVADALRTSIIKGQLRGRHPLRQEELAEQYGVSKIPVREALFQLQAEGLVDFSPGRGATVSELTPEDANEIYIMRIALEPVALRNAIPHLQERDLIQAESALKQIDEENDPTRWGALNWEFHTTLYKPAKLPRLFDTLKMWQTNVARYFFVYQEMTYREKSNAEHWAILDACRRGNSDEACDQLAEHLRLASAELIEYLSKK